MARRIKLSPVRVKESENYRQPWKRRSQILGSVLHWAHHAGANRVDFDPNSDEPFTYTTPSGETVSTELGDTPTEYVDSIAQFIRDTIDGHPLVRPIRCLFRILTRTAIEAEIEIPPTSLYSGSTWFCRMTGDIARFKKLSTAEPVTGVG